MTNYDVNGRLGVLNAFSTYEFIECKSILSQGASV